MHFNMARLHLESSFACYIAEQHLRSTSLLINWPEPTYQQLPRARLRFVRALSEINHTPHT